MSAAALAARDVAGHPRRRASGRGAPTGSGRRSASRRRRRRRRARCRCGCPRRPSSRCPSAAIVRPSGSQVGAANIDRGPRVIAVTARVSTSTTWMSRCAATRSASRRRFEVKAIRRPSGDQAGCASAARPSVRRLRRAGRGVDQPEVADPVVGEAGAVEHVVEPVDEPVVGRRRRARARGVRSMPRRRSSSARVAACEVRDDDEPRAVGRPLEGVDAARQVGQPARLAAVERQQVDLARRPRGPCRSSTSRPRPGGSSSTIARGPR